MMEIKGASASKPLIGGDYMEARVVSYHDGNVQFQVGFNRYRIAPDKADGIYDITSGDSVIASIRMKKGLGVIEGIYVNGIPLEASSNGAAMERPGQPGRVTEEAGLPAGPVSIGSKNAAIPISKLKLWTNWNNMLGQ